MTENQDIEEISLRHNRIDILGVRSMEILAKRLSRLRLLDVRNNDIPHYANLKDKSSLIVFFWLHISLMWRLINWFIINNHPHESRALLLALGRWLQPSIGPHSSWSRPRESCSARLALQKVHNSWPLLHGSTVAFGELASKEFRNGLWEGREESKGHGIRGSRQEIGSE